MKCQGAQLKNIRTQQGISKSKVEVKQFSLMGLHPNLRSNRDILTQELTIRVRARINSHFARALNAFRLQNETDFYKIKDIIQHRFTKSATPGVDL